MLRVWSMLGNVEFCSPTVLLTARFANKLWGLVALEQHIHPAPVLRMHNQLPRASWHWSNRNSFCHLGPNLCHFAKAQRPYLASRQWLMFALTHGRFGLATTFSETFQADSALQILSPKDCDHTCVVRRVLWRKQKLFQRDPD